MNYKIVLAFLFTVPYFMYCADDIESRKQCVASLLECAENQFIESSYRRAEKAYETAFRQSTFQALDQQAQIRAKVNCAEAMLAQGNYKKGHEYFDARLENQDLKRKPLQKPWDGTPLNKDSSPLLIRGEHGIGDTFFFLRYMKKADEMGVSVTVRERGFLKPILSRQPYIKKVIASDQDEANMAYNADIYSMSLPRYISNRGLQPVQTIEDIPYPHGYIEPRVDLVEHWKGNFSKKPGFNIVIGAYRASANIAGECRFLQRDVPIAALLTALWMPGVNLYYCSGGDHRPIKRSDYDLVKADGMLGKLDEHDIVEDADMSKFEILEGEKFDQKEGAFEGAAAAMCAADCVVSVDTSLAMLAGALGYRVKKVFIVLPKRSDWRWGEGQPTTTPFFANATLFWQQEQNDWSAPLAALSSDVEKSVATAGKSE